MVFGVHLAVVVPPRIITNLRVTLIESSAPPTECLSNRNTALTQLKYTVVLTPFSPEGKGKEYEVSAGGSNRVPGCSMSPDHVSYGSDVVSDGFQSLWLRGKGISQIRTVY